MQKMLFSHTARSIGLSVLGVFRSHGVSEFSCLCRLLPLTCPTHPPTMYFLGCCRISCSALWLFLYANLVSRLSFSHFVSSLFVMLFANELRC